MSEHRFRRSRDCTEWLASIGVPDVDRATRVVLVFDLNAPVRAEVSYKVDPLYIDEDPS